ncbi:hypothetical protein OIO90_003074 [Microbotryomycetes sp. JL221]|nr:hypothetical protein OIO90_003074 [Microbotryomycetes sp. JL221]
MAPGDHDGAPTRVAVTRALPTNPSRSASLVVSSRSRQQVVDSPRGPIKFAIPPRRQYQQAQQHHQPLPPQHESPRSPAALFKRLSRTLSNSGTAQLVRRVSGSKKPSSARQSRSSSPPQQRLTVPEIHLLHDEVERDAQGPTLCDWDEHVPSGGAALLRTRGLRALGRSRSEGQRRVRVAKEEEKMDELVMRTELSSRGEDASDVRSGMGSYFWSDSLGLCWDGREQVHPDLLAGQPTYSSDANFVPQSSRVVYASTLSTFPPRPPLRRLSSANQESAGPKLSEAQAIAAAYRDANPTCTATDVFASSSNVSSRGVPSPAPMAPPTSSTDVRTCARSVASDSSSSDSPSELNMAARVNGRDSAESSTSIESISDGSSSTSSPLRAAFARNRARKTAALPPSPLGLSDVVIQRIQLVDDGPVTIQVSGETKTKRATFSTTPLENGGNEDDATSQLAQSDDEDWRECE